MERLKKAAIIAEYLTGCLSYRELQAKYGGSLGSMHRWIKEYGETMNEAPIKKVPVKESVDKLMDEELGKPMPDDVKTLQAELRRLRLHNKLLVEVITIAEEELSAPILKKYGTRQS
jgi:transposase-like protein